MESPRDQELISTLTLVQRLLWWPENLIQQSAGFVLSYFSNGDESGEKDHGNEFRGSKNGGKELWGGLKWPENGRKIKKLPVTHGGHRRRFAGLIPTRPAAVSREISWPASSRCPPPTCLVLVQ